MNSAQYAELFLTESREHVSAINHSLLELERGVGGDEPVGAIFRGEELLITCELVYVFADPATQTSRPVPQALRELLLGFEAGQAARQLKSGSWAELGQDAGLRMESLMAGIAQSEPEAKQRMRDFLEKRGAKVKRR